MQFTKISIEEAVARTAPFFAISQVGNQFTAQYHMPGENTLWFGEFATLEEAKAELDRPSSRYSIRPMEPR